MNCFFLEQVLSKNESCAGARVCWESTNRRPGVCMTQFLPDSAPPNRARSTGFPAWCVLVERTADRPEKADSCAEALAVKAVKLDHGLRAEQRYQLLSGHRKYQDPGEGIRCGGGVMLLLWIDAVEARLRRPPDRGCREELSAVRWPRGSACFVDVFLVLCVAGCFVRRQPGMNEKSAGGKEKRQSVAVPLEATPTGKRYRWR